LFHILEPEVAGGWRESRRASVADVGFASTNLGRAISALGRLQHLQASSTCPIGAVSRQRLATWLRGAEGAALVGHEKERWHCDPSFASSPAPRQGDGRGHRRGLDGPSMPKPLTKQRMFSSTG